MGTQSESTTPGATIWDCDEERAALWVTEPARAAVLAYLEVVALWHDQVEQGIYWGVPALHRLPGNENTRNHVSESATMRSRPVRFVRDGSAGMWIVPGQVRSLWLAAA